jgi:arylsulfatase A-like enzyme
VVVWIVVDTLRADSLGCYGNRSVGENGARPSPNVDALAADGVRFDEARSVAPWTIPSLVSTMSGRWPWEHGQNRLLQRCPDASLELVPLLRERGLRTAGVMTNFVATGRYGFDHGFDRWDDSFAQGHEGSTGGEAVRRLLALADELRPDAKEGLFLFAWLFEPHYRYEEHEGLRFGPGFGDAAGTPYRGTLTGQEELPDLQKRRAELGPEDAAFLRGRYQSEVAAVDRAIGELFDGLRARGLWDDALIVFSADHGEEILDRGWIGHSVTLHRELVRAPLVVRLPRGDAESRRGKVVEAPVSLVDLPATLLELATGRGPDRARGELGHSRSLERTVRDGAKPERRWIYLHTDFEPPLGNARAETRALQWGVLDAETRLEWIVDRKGEPEALPRTFLFDLAADPGETRNLAETPEGRESARALQRLRALVPDRLDGERPAPEALPEESWIRKSADRSGLGPAFEGGS